ncbi:hypothetical protein [Telluria beijingensis]|uniref:hypothetical protein n=1 Tax=Telluria beijingensis TaxID=3068633 RepID=UPI002795E072|nr:hypothetical protein [Massilia sp. REN29]
MIEKCISNTKVLLLGFSVTEDRLGYAHVAKKLLLVSHPEIDLYICGVGGITPQPLSVLFEHVDKQHGPFSHVFLEISTSAHSKYTLHSVERDVLDVAYDLFRKIQTTGAEVSLINLYRKDFDYEYHYFDMLLESLSARFQIPLLDLGNKLLAERGREALAPFLKDYVHTTEAGADFQGREAARFIGEVVTSGARNKKTPLPRTTISSLSVISQVTNASQYWYKRGGIELTAASIDEGNEIEILIPDGYSVCGISFLSGPRSGKLGLRFDSAEMETIISTYDEYCYYERFNYRWFNSHFSGKSVAVRQISGTPDVELRKGSVDSRPRIGRIFDIYLAGQSFSG